MNRRREKHYQKLALIEFTQSDFDAMDVNGDRQVTKSEFVRYMLEKIDPDTYEDLCKTFQHLDVTKDGVCTQEDQQQLLNLQLCRKLKKNRQ